MGMSDPKVVPISGTMRPSRKLRRMARALHGEKFSSNVRAMLEDAAIVDAVAKSLERAFEAGLTKDGRIDFREAAIHMIAEMRRHQL